MHVRWMNRTLVGGASALVAFAMIAATMTSRAEAQEVVVQGQPAPPAQYAQPQPYYAPPPQPAYQQPVYAQPAQPAQPRTVTRPNIGLIVSGSVLLGVGWVTNFITGLPAGDDPFTSGSEPEWDAFRVTSLIPVAGPWIQLGVKPTAFSQDYWAPWLIINGLMQVSGVTMLIIGASTSRTETVAAAEPNFRMAFVPQLGPVRAGGALIGSF